MYQPFNGIGMHFYLLMCCTLFSWRKKSSATTSLANQHQGATKLSTTLVHWPTPRLLAKMYGICQDSV